MSLHETPAGRPVRSLTATVWAAGALIVWSAHFLVVYVAAAVLCATGLADADWLGFRPIVPVTALATALALAMLAVLALAPAGRPTRGGADRDADRFLAWQTRGFAALAAVGVLHVAYPVAVLGGTCS